MRVGGVAAPRRVKQPGSGFHFATFIGVVGPGLISGGADNDPAGIATYSIVGATVGFAQNWLLFFSTPMLIVVQQMSAKVANVTKSDLASSPAHDFRRPRGHSRRRADGGGQRDHDGSGPVGDGRGG